MVEQLQGGVSLDFLKQDSDFLAAPPEQQKAYLQQYVLPDLDPDFAQAPPEEQNAYLDQYVLPNFIPNPTPQPLPPTQTPPPVSPPAVAQRPINKPIDPLGGYTAMGQFGAFAAPYIPQGIAYGASAGKVLPKQGYPQTLAGQVPFTVGDLIGGLVAAGSGALLGAGGLAATGGTYAGIREANRQSLNRGGGRYLDPTPYGQLPQAEKNKIAQGVATQGIFGALTTGLPAALGRGLLAKIGTGAALGGAQGVTQNALEQYTDKGKVDIKETLPAGLFGGALGGGIGAISGTAPTMKRREVEQPPRLPLVTRALRQELTGGKPRVNLETEAKLLPQPQEPTPLGRVPRDVTEAIDAIAAKAINKPVQKPAGRPAPAKQEQPSIVPAKAKPVEPKQVEAKAVKDAPTKAQRRAEESPAPKVKIKKPATVIKTDAQLQETLSPLKQKPKDVEGLIPKVVLNEDEVRYKSTEAFKGNADEQIYSDSIDTLFRRENGDVRLIQDELDNLVDMDMITKPKDWKAIKTQDELEALLTEDYEGTDLTFAFDLLDSQNEYGHKYYAIENYVDDPRNPNTGKTERDAMLGYLYDTGKYDIIEPDASVLNTEQIAKSIQKYFQNEGFTVSLKRSGLSDSHYLRVYDDVRIGEGFSQFEDGYEIAIRNHKAASQHSVNGYELDVDSRTTPKDIVEAVKQIQKDIDETIADRLFDKKRGGKFWAKPVVEAFEATEALGKQIDADPSTADLPSPPSPRQAKIDAQVERYNKALANNDPIEQGGAARMIEAELALAIKNDGMDKAGFVKATKDMPKEVFDDIAKRLNCGG